MPRFFAPSAAVLFLLTACASSHAIDLDAPRSVVGAEDGVRVDAQILEENIAPGGRVPITWEITNQRSTPIAVADLIPETSYDSESNAFTVTIGAEVPGNELLPRLIEIGPGQKKAFSGTASVRFITPPRPANPLEPRSSPTLRLRVNFLGDVEPFRQLVGLSENALADAKLADTLFPLWLEANEAVFTNAVPMRWGGRRTDAPPPSEGRRRGI